MCGICFTIQNYPIDVLEYNKYSDRCSHRGPNEYVNLSIKLSGFNHINLDRPSKSKECNIKMSFHRLAIQDVNNQHQPFVMQIYNDNSPIYRRVCLICNGEIYNYKKLIEDEKLENTKSDCRVIIDLYLKYGIEKTCQMLDGEFAFVLLDFYGEPAGIGGFLNNHNSKLQYPTYINKCYNGLDSDLSPINMCTVYYARDRFGIRPLYHPKYNVLNDRVNSLTITSELKSTPNDNILYEQVTPATIYKVVYDYQMNENTYIRYPPVEYYRIENYCNKTTDSMYYISDYIPETIPDYTDTEEYKVYCNQIKNLLYTSIVDRMKSEKQIGALLSGGLDSSLVCSVVQQELNKQGKKLRTFSIGISEDSTDIINSRIVANYINSEHKEIIIPVEDWIKVIPEVIRQIESYDVTTIRASVGQWLISRWISQNTDVKVLLCGDGSDEVCCGYLYYHSAPTYHTADLDNIKLLKNIHKYDVQRVDRCVSGFGLEARVPFLAHEFVNYYLNIPKKYSISRKTLTKKVLRDSFADTLLLPDQILYRKKEAFSDGVSSTNSSWYKSIEKHLTDIQYKPNKFSYPLDDTFDTLNTLEAKYYYDIFSEYYPNSGHVISYYWMPNWNEKCKDPSARALSFY